MDQYDKSYIVGYFVGRIVTRTVIITTGLSSTLKTFKFVKRVAAIHKIDSSNPIKVTENVFDCLQYLD